MMHQNNENLKKSWDILWYWEWLINKKWPLSNILSSYAATTVDYLLPILNEYKVKSILDVTSGFGLKTVLLKLKGFDTFGSDFSDVAILAAQELVKRENINIEYLVSDWKDLSKTWGNKKFDCVYCDSLSWEPDALILREACKSFYNVLNDNGILIWSGISKGTDQHTVEQLAIDRFKSKPNKKTEDFWRLENGTNLKRTLNYMLDGANVVAKRVYISEKEGVTKTENSTILEAAGWSWENMQNYLEDAGFRNTIVVESSVDGKVREHNVSFK